jgi:phage gp36-like protein
MTLTLHQAPVTMPIRCCDIAHYREAIEDHHPGITDYIAVQSIFQRAL